jgi:hypothetical protein
MAETIFAGYSDLGDLSRIDMLVEMVIARKKKIRKRANENEDAFCGFTCLDLSVLRRPTGRRSNPGMGRSGGGDAP